MQNQPKNWPQGGAERGSRQEFFNAPEREQQVRAKRLDSLLARERGNYLDFCLNLYKYPDRFKGNSEKNTKIFNQLSSGSRILERAFAFFLAQKRNQDTKGAHEELGNIIQSDTGGISDPNNFQIDIDKAKEMFRWGLDLYVNGGGEKIGRTPTISGGEIDSLVDDMGEILTKVNQWR